MIRLAAAAALLCVFGTPFQIGAPVDRARFTSDCECEVVAHITIDDAAATQIEVAAFQLRIDGADSPDHALLFLGSGRRDYDVVLGPVTPGAHEAQLVASPLWPRRPAPITGFTIRKADSVDAGVLSHAPVLWMRADTIGTASDLPLLLYAERRRSNAGDELTYTFIFSNEDGGTSTAALMARWGRTTDIEWAYRAQVAGGRTVSEEYQSANHGVRPFGGPHIGAHPVLVDATLNNNFSDTGQTAARTRLLPKLVDLTSATRESVADAEPWIYGIMFAELQREGKLLPGAEPDFSSPSLDLIPDPRSFIYVDARLTVSSAAVSAWARDDAGTLRSSSGGLADFRVARSEWVRIAVPTGGRPVTAVGFECAPVRTTPPSREPGGCAIDLARAFRLGPRLVPGPNVIQAARFELKPGELRLVEVR